MGASIRKLLLRLAYVRITRPFLLTMLLYFLFKSEIRAVAMGENPELTAVQGANSHLLSWGWKKAIIFPL